MIIRTSKDSVIIDAKLDLATFARFQSAASKLYPHDSLRTAMNHAVELFLLDEKGDLQNVASVAETTSTRANTYAEAVAPLFKARGIYRSMRIPHMPELHQLEGMTALTHWQRLEYAESLAREIPWRDFTREKIDAFADAVLLILLSVELSR